MCPRKTQELFLNDPLLCLLRCPTIYKSRFRKKKVNAVVRRGDAIPRKSEGREEGGRERWEAKTKQSITQAAAASWAEHQVSQPHRHLWTVCTAAPYVRPVQQTTKREHRVSSSRLPPVSPWSKFASLEVDSSRPAWVTWGFHTNTSQATQHTCAMVAFHSCPEVLGAIRASGGLWGAGLGLPAGVSVTPIQWWHRSPSRCQHHPGEGWDSLWGQMRWRWSWFGHGSKSWDSFHKQVAKSPTQSQEKHGS